MNRAILFSLALGMLAGCATVSAQQEARVEYQLWTSFRPMSRADWQEHQSTMPTGTHYRINIRPSRVNPEGEIEVLSDAVVILEEGKTANFHHGEKLAGPGEGVHITVSVVQTNEAVAATVETTIAEVEQLVWSHRQTLVVEKQATEQQSNHTIEETSR